MHPGDTKLMKYGKLALFLLPIFLIVAYLIKEKDLKNAEYDEDKIRNGGRGLIVYAILSFILLFVLAVVLQRHSLGG
jgi:TRAP-type mannitol/chloroaromatic compound transport system permease small subunit